MKAVIDASAAFIMLTSPEAVAAFLVDAQDVLAPDLIVAELLNARWKLARTGAVAPQLDSILGLLERITLRSALFYAADAADLGQRLNHPIYDCLYAAIATRERARLVTADRRFAGKLNGLIVDVISS